MKNNDKPIKNNPVAKNQPEFCKARVFRDRKKQPTDKEALRNHPLHEPYKREPLNLLIEDEGEYDMWDAVMNDDDDYEDEERRESSDDQE